MVMDNWIGVKYKNSSFHFAAFAGRDDAETFLDAIRKDEPHIEFIAFWLHTGEVLDW